MSAYHAVAPTPYNANIPALWNPQWAYPELLFWNYPSPGYPFPDFNFPVLPGGWAYPQAWPDASVPLFGGPGSTYPGLPWVAQANWLPAGQWNYPTIPWAPGWPIPAPASRVMNALAPATIKKNGAATLEGYLTVAGVDDAALDGHLIQVAASIGGRPIGIKRKASDQFKTVLIYKVKNYSGTRHGFKDNVLFNIQDSNAGSTITLNYTVVSTNPIILGTTTATAARGIVFAAVSYGGNVMTSPDGVTWTARSVPVGNWEYLCWSSQLSLFVAVGANIVMTSPDGVNWTAGTAITGGWESVCWSPTLSLFVAVGSGPMNYVMTSPDGVTWTTRNAPSGGDFTSLETVCWASSLNLFVAAGYGFSTTVITSSDGINWTLRTAGNNALNNIAFSSSIPILVAAGNNGKAVSSPDGVTWTANNTAQLNQLYGICWAASLAPTPLFVAVSVSGVNRVQTSPDGINWTVRNAAEANQWLSVCWSPTLSLFVAVADTGVHMVMTSPDGVNWTARTAADGSLWFCVVATQ